jgi:signal transduction histidine kinase
MLSRLRIRQKLGVLLLIPLVSVALVLAAFATERVADARRFAATAQLSLVARDIGGLIQDLQQERLLTIGYLEVATIDRSAVVAQAQDSADELVQLADTPRTAAIIARARPLLEVLNLTRAQAVSRATSPVAVYFAFSDAVNELLDALGLARPPAADADSMRELLALDALMRANEEASRAGAITIGAAVDPTFTPTLLSAASDEDAQYLGRFRELVDPQEVPLVDTIGGGQASQRLTRYSNTVLNGGAPRGDAEISDALTAALSYSQLRRLAEDRVARDEALLAQSATDQAQLTAELVAGGGAVLFLAVLALAVTVSRSIAQPLGRLTRAVGAVAELSRAELVRVADSEALDVAPPELASVEVDSEDEIGELAAAVNRVQFTAASMLERQATARANVATMFANVSRRTQNLVGRQLQIIEEVTRAERDPGAREMLARLEHVTTRLRRGADSLLVVSGTVDQQINAVPARLADVIDAALLEIEGYEKVELVEPIPDVAVSAELAGDLRLLLGELLENATNFTPPGSSVRIGVNTDPRAGDCTIAVADNGLGMSPTRMEEENRRLVERERLDVAPTRVLGLFVVGRLARRHGLSVRLDPSPGRGVVALVRVPGRHLSPASAPGSAVPAVGVVPAHAVAAIESAARSGPFNWLATRSGPLAVGAAPAPRHAGAGRRAGGRPGRDPEAERDALNEYLSGIARGAREVARVTGDTAPEPDPRSTLAERP